MDAEDCIIFADGRSRVTVTPVGPPTLGFPLRIDVESGPFVASVEAEAWDYEQFLESVVQVYKTLTGSVRREFCGATSALRTNVRYAKFSPEDVGGEGLSC